jgi:adenylate cyclase
VVLSGGGTSVELPLFEELKRRRVVRTLVAYAIAAFAILQIIEPVMHGLHWPDAVLSYTAVALAVGFPVVVALAWAFDVRAGRIERAPAGELRGARLALVLLAIGLGAAAPGVIYYFVLRRPASATAQPMPSIAVLPFVNLSSDKEQEYFSDGISEEILNSLTQVEGLRVIGRTSSFSICRGLGVVERVLPGYRTARSGRDGRESRVGCCARAGSSGAKSGFRLFAGRSA